MSMKQDMCASEKFLRRFLGKLKSKNFDINETMSNFYASYKKSGSDELFEFYTSYLLRDVASVDSNTVSDLCVRIQTEMISKSKVKVSTVKTKKTMTINKKSALSVLCSFIKVADRVMSLSERFLMRYFDKLVSKNFASDPFLKGFYQAYTKDQEEFGKESLFSFYMEYLLRNVDYSTTSKHQKITELCESIKNEMFAPDEEGHKPSTSTNDNRVHNVTLNKKKSLMTISNFIKASNIVTYDNPDETTTKQDEDFRIATTANIIKEIKASGKTIPKAQIDAASKRRSELLNIWQDTEHKCVEFINNDALASVLEKVYFVDGQLLGTARQTTTLPCMDVLDIKGNPSKLLMEVTGQPKRKFDTPKRSDIESDLPIEILVSKRSSNTYNTKVRLLNNWALSETMARKNKEHPVVYICSGSQMVPGGCADQGVETNERIVYLASSYHLCIRQAAMGYPLKPTQMLMLPSVLVFKDHSNSKFPMLPPAKGTGISIIMAPGIYRPPTNLVNSHQHGVDKRLNLPNTKYKDTTTLLQRYRSMLNTALFFGYDTVVLDDQGVLDFWLPVHQTALLLMQVINEFNNKFREIVVAIHDKEVYAIFRNYLR